MHVDGVEWDTHNLDHACRAATVAEIEQVILAARVWRRHRRDPGRVLFTDRTGRGTQLTVIARYEPDRRLVRPITAWRETS